jgi:hypothetical protein
LTDLEIRPAKCRLRLKDEGKTYPRSTCQACRRRFQSWDGIECSPAEAEVERLKSLVGRYAKHLTQTARRDEVASILKLDRPGPWLTFEERQEIKRYAERPF